MLRQPYIPESPFEELELVVKTATSLISTGKCMMMDDAVKDAARLILMAQDLLNKIEGGNDEDKDSRQPTQDQGEQETRN